MSMSGVPGPESVEFADRSAVRSEAHSSGVSWAAVIGGAFVAAAFYLILLALGSGLGLSAVSPWSNSGLSASVLGGAAIAWLIFIEIVASALGGYLTGRLRTRWVRVHTDEVYFRDTANGFLSWAVALVISVTFLVSAATRMVGRSAQSGAAVGTSAASSSASESNRYFADVLFRSDQMGAESRDAATRAEAGRILANALWQAQMPASDQTYLARLVANKTGMSQAEAEKRVSDVIGQEKQREDTARKEMARLLLWLFVAFLVGALSASYAATIGGRQRDHVPAV